MEMEDGRGEKSLRDPKEGEHLACSRSSWRWSCWCTPGEAAESRVEGGGITEATLVVPCRPW